MEFDLSDLEDFCKEVEGEEERQADLTVCICGLPSTEKLISCGNPSCPIVNLHQQCVSVSDGRRPIDTDWFCENCRETALPGPSTAQDTPVGNETHRPSVSSAQETTVKSQTSAQMKYPKRRFSKVDAASQTSEYSKEALAKVFQAPMFCMQTPLTKKVKEVAKNIQEMHDNEKVTAYFQKVTKKLWKKVASLVRGRRWTEDLRAEMWGQFHILRCNKNLQKLWSELLSGLGVECGREEEVFLFQHIIEEVFGSLLKDMMERDMPVKVTMVQSDGMDENEEQALRYCSGYVLMKLIKRYKRMKANTTAVKFSEVLASWSSPVDQDEGESVEDFTSVWLQKQNRGGLFHINDNVYSLFKSMELVVRSCIHKGNIEIFKHVDIQVTLFAKLQESDAVWKNWGIICTCLPDQGKVKLFEEVVKCFLKMRCEAFLRVYILIRKAKDNEVSKKGEKSLRKQLRKT